VNGLAAGKSPGGTDCWNLPDSSVYLGTTAQTILVIRKKIDTAIRQSALFGNIPSLGQRCSAHVPWDDGVVYFDFGGAVAPNRVIWSGYTPTTNVEAWAFRAGPSGSSIWLDGIQKATQATAITRSAMTEVFWINNNGGVAGDLQDTLFLALVPDEVPDALLAQFTPAVAGSVDDNTARVTQNVPEVVEQDGGTGRVTQHVPEVVEQDGGRARVTQDAPEIVQQDGGRARVTQDCLEIVMLLLHPATVITPEAASTAIDADRRTPGPTPSVLGDDPVLVYDFLYDRWYHSNLRASTMLAEFDTNTLISGQADGHIYQLEDGYTDSGAAIPFEVWTKSLHLGAPDQDKQWGDLALDIDTGGQTVTVQLYFNNGDLSDAPVPVSTFGRKLVQIPIVVGNSKMALNCQLRISGSVGVRVTIYKAIFRVLLEPPRRRSFVTEWTKDGSDGRKIYRTVVLELDTLGGQINVDFQLDGAETAVQTFPLVETTGRELLYLSMEPDIVGKLRRLYFRQANDGLESVFKLYNEKVEALPQPINPIIFQSEWTDKGYPYSKYWKEIVLEVDTFGGNRTVEFQLDNARAQLLTVNTASRRRVTLSLNQDLIGKLGRILITGGETALYAHDYVVEPEPPDVTIADTLELTFGYDRYKVLKRMWVTMKAPAAVTLKIYADEALRTTETLPASNLTTGWKKLEVKLPSGIKGKLLRFVFTSPVAFRLYWTQLECEFKPLGTGSGWSRYKFQPPQLM
jgi:hypothetical protein